MGRDATLRAERMIQIQMISKETNQDKGYHL